MAGGFHNGFNPFRDAHGRWATPGGHAAGIHGPPEGAAGKGGGAMNDALRSASGRATGGGGGGDGGSGESGGGGSPFSATAIKSVFAQPEVKAATFSADTTAKLDAMAEAHGVKGGWQNGLQASYEGLNGAAFSQLSQGRAQVPQANVDTLIQAYKEAGFNPPAASKADLLALMDHFEGVEFGSKAEANLTAYSIAAALKGGDQGAALNFADGREGAGIGWDLTRQELLGNPA